MLMLPMIIRFTPSPELLKKALLLDLRKHWTPKFYHDFLDSENHLCTTLNCNFSKIFKFYTDLWKWIKFIIAVYNIGWNLLDYKLYES